MGVLDGNGRRLADASQGTSICIRDIDRAKDIESRYISLYGKFKTAQIEIDASSIEDSEMASEGVFFASHTQNAYPFRFS